MWVSFGDKLINFRYVNIIYPDVREDRCNLVVCGTHGLIAEEGFTCLEQLEARMKDLSALLINK